MATSEFTTQVCRSCGIEKPVNDFYVVSGTERYYDSCKECYKTRQRKAKYSPKTRAGHDGERLVINQLRSMGIYAAPGKSSEYRYVDVVAWGCVRIEVKYSSLAGREYHWRFSNKQSKEGFRADIVVLVTADNQDNNFYVFLAEDQIFRRPDGKMKQGIEYTLNARVYPARFGESLTKELLAQHKDAWHLIEQQRLVIAKMYQDDESLSLVI